jgi:hypothetical protein
MNGIPVCQAGADILPLQIHALRSRCSVFGRDAEEEKERGNNRQSECFHNPSLVECSSYLKSHQINASSMAAAMSNDVSMGRILKNLPGLSLA